MSVGTRLGPYEVVSAIGAGGMGEVYKARDTKLNRDVAIKVLPDLFASDPERLARFTREAQTLAALNHPNIAHIHGLEDSPSAGAGQAGVRALVMELVEGEDLSQVIARGPVPVADAVAIATQIADALEAAHEQGIVHRDLKPANIKVRPDGTVKVLDFGLAKAMDPGSRGPEQSAHAANSPTFTRLNQGYGEAGSHVGMILGTAAYMAPEQAKGKTVDKRADIWAFGCVVYEMVTGRRAFPGDGVSDTLAKVLEREPDWTAMPAGTPAHVRALIECCLRKDPARRLRDIGDARLQLEDGPVAATAAPVPPSRARWLMPLVGAGAIVAGLGLGWYLRTATMGVTGGSASTSAQLDLLLPDGFELFTISGSRLTIAPDGSRVAFVAGGGGSRAVFMRALDAPVLQRLRGTDAALTAFFSPDGASLGLLSRDRALTRLSLRDGLVTNIGAGSGTNAPIWGADGFIVVGRAGLWRVPASGGSPVSLTTLDAGRGEVAHSPAVVLPSGVVLFTSWVADGDSSRIEAVSPVDGVRRLVVDRASAPIYASTGHLLFHRDGAILAARFDAGTARVTGDAVLVFPAGVVRLSSGIPQMALSENGTLVYAPAQTGLVKLVRVLRDGSSQPLTDTAQPYVQPRVSPDGTRVVVEHASDSLWLHDLSRDARTPLTPGRLPGVSFPIWARDGRRIVYRRFDDLWWVETSGSGRAGRISGGQPGDIPAALAPDGETLAVLRAVGSSGGDLFALSMTGAWPARPIVQTQGYDGGADFSPDGKWLVYASTDSGPSQVYLSPFPGMDRKWSLSTRGGNQPRFSRTGREVFYRDGNRMMAVAVDVAGADVRLSSPRVLFERDFTSGAFVTIANYDVTPDGAFVMTQSEPGAPRLTVVLNWLEDLKRRFGVTK